MLYTGSPLGDGPVHLVSPPMDELDSVETGEIDEWGPWARWREAARTDPTVMYFAVERARRLVGEMFLHDIEASSKQAMVGFRIFAETDRRVGTGSEALKALIDWVSAEGKLDRLFAITRADNVSSRHLVERLGFTLRGKAREDDHRVVYELWIAHP